MATLSTGGKAAAQAWSCATPTGDKIIIATGEDGHAVFFSVHANASGSVIDFIKHRQGGSLGYARGLPS